MAALGGSLYRSGLIASGCAASLVGGLAIAEPASLPPGSAQPAVRVSVSPDDVLARAAALDAAVRLASPGASRSMPSAVPFAAHAPTLNVRYRLLPGAAISPYVGGSLVSADALAGVNRGGMSLDLKHGASVAVGFDTDKTGEARVKLDMGLQQVFSAGPTYDHGTSSPTIVGAGVGMRF